jgi:hypothetical protein
MRITPLLTVLALATLGSAAPARAASDADRPLLVVVEVGRGMGVGASDVRQAVAAELGKNVVGTREASADGATDVLLVVLDPGEIRMSLRAGAASIISRAIAVPPDRNGRLRSIGWLAGNLVRDQVGPIVATREAAAAPAVEALAAPEPPALTTTAPPPSAASPPPPVPSTSVPAPSAPPVVASSAAVAPAAIPHAIWSITASGGPVATATRDGIGVARQTNITGSNAFQLELQRQKSPDSMLLGVALTAGPSAPRHYVGAAAFAGEAWRGRSWFAEATLGLGIEALDGYVRIDSTTGTAPTPDNPATITSMSESKVPLGPVPGLFVRAAGTGGYSVSRFFDLVAQLGAHISSEGDIGSYLGATAGVRLRL